MKKDDIEEFIRRLSEAMPEPETELEYQSPFELLVAVALSAQATDVSVNACTRKLYPVANTPDAILALGEEGLAEYIKTIGLWRNKAKNVIALCRILIDEHGGVVPETREELQSLPGVGRKTADVVLNVAFGQPTIAVDTHIFRVSNRTGLASGKTADQVADKLPKRIPAPYLQDAHHWLILHGRYVCKARTPECWRCEVNDLCGFKPKTPSPEEQKAAKKAAPKRKAVKKAARKKKAA
ncbi:endonuclease III [Parvularcula sp. ZS-1/3]|uniref:Endonuclease III n=1 Tax=Parvularcula mediterranea TaxID=2732508 RepID=A0A7Y3RKQ6_9PROT|nr:endonuclease III [Parvularcula mediterranea]NNU15858.1 endonuclease III [Parvularcula mediterranea]